MSSIGPGITRRGRCPGRGPLEQLVVVERDGLLGVERREKGRSESVPRLVDRPHDFVGEHPRATGVSTLELLTDVRGLVENVMLLDELLDQIIVESRDPGETSDEPGPVGRAGRHADARAHKRDQPRTARDLAQLLRLRQILSELGPVLPLIAPDHLRERVCLLVAQCDRDVDVVLVGGYPTLLVDHSIQFAANFATAAATRSEQRHRDQTLLSVGAGACHVPESRELCAHSEELLEPRDDVGCVLHA